MFTFLKVAQNVHLLIVHEVIDINIQYFITVSYSRLLFKDGFAVIDCFCCRNSTICEA